MKYVLLILSMVLMFQLLPLTEYFESVYTAVPPFDFSKLDNLPPFFLVFILLLLLILFQKWRQTRHINELNRTFQDQVSLREATEVRIKDREVHYRDFFEDNLSGSFVVHPLGKLIACNQEYARIFGCDSVQDAISRPVTTFLQSPEQGRDFIKKIKAEKMITHYRLQLKKTTGHPLFLAIYGTGRFSDQDELEHIRGFILDITEDKAEDKAEEQNRLRPSTPESIGSLANGVAHDLNNILSGIIGYTQLAKQNLKMPVKLEPNLNQILTGARRAADLVKRILNFSRPSASAKQVLNLVPLIKEVLALLHSTIPSTIVIEEHLFSKAMVLADPGKMHQVIMNLCSNACQAMSQGKGLLTVGLDEQVVSRTGNMGIPDMPFGSYLRLRVRDTGPGIEDRIMEKIFDPYFTTKELGTGLGLSLVKGIVDEHGGYIDVTSFNGRGTTFSVFLPIAERPLSHEQPCSMPSKILETSLPGGGENIMFVHAQEKPRLLATEFLGGLGYHAYGFANENDAIEAFQRNPHHYDLIVTDQAMPVKCGFDFPARVVSIKPDIPVIVCSDSRQELEPLIPPAANGMCMKTPLRLDDLAMAVRELLDTPKQPLL